MAGISDLRSAAITHIAGLVPQNVKVEAFAGDVVMESLALKHIGTQVVYVAFLQAENVAPEGSLDFNMQAQFAAFVLTRNGKGAEDREDKGLALVEAIALGIHGQNFGLGHAAPALVLGLENLTDAAFLKNSISVWVLAWEQFILFNGGV